MAKNSKKALSKSTPDGEQGEASASRYGARADAMRWAEDVATRRDLDPEWTRRAIAQARRLRDVPRLVLPPARATAKNWAAYRSRFVEPVRLRAGQRFWSQHAQALERAEEEFGVPAEVIVGIIGVETIYGQQMGNYRVIDALATLAFDFPAAHPRAAERQAFFASELEQFLSLHHRAGSDPLAPRGSFAGPVGMPQFMPSRWPRYPSDFDGDGRVDLFDSPVDAIGSVANYLRAHQWKPGMPTHYPARFDAARLDLPTLLAPDILPTFSADALEAKGVILGDDARRHEGPLALVELFNGDAEPSYVIGTENFYAVTRYNWSSYYALAVIELGRAVAQARERR